MFSCKDLTGLGRQAGGGAGGAVVGRQAGGRVTPPHCAGSPQPLLPPRSAPSFETTAHSIAWSLYELAANPEVQAKVAAELAAAGLLGPSRRPLEYSDLSELRYLNMVRQLSFSALLFLVPGGLPAPPLLRAWRGVVVGGAAGPLVGEPPCPPAPSFPRAGAEGVDAPAPRGQHRHRQASRSASGRRRSIAALWRPASRHRSTLLPSDLPVFPLACMQEGGQDGGAGRLPPRAPHHPLGAAGGDADLTAQLGAGRGVLARALGGGGAAAGGRHVRPHPVGPQQPAQQDVPALQRR